VGYSTTHPHLQPEQQLPHPYVVPVVFGPARRARYAYRVLRQGGSETLDEDQLNRLGAEGWLLISVLPRAESGKTLLEYLFVRTEP
jgi:hypothetical protein